MNTSNANSSMSVRAVTNDISFGPVELVYTLMFRSGNSVTREWWPMESPP